jgi:hypothetical protein
MPFDDQVPTHPVTILSVMQDPKFGLGVADVRTGRGYHPGYETWDGNEQWNYERGRQWATLAPRDLALKKGGKVTAEAIAWFRRVDQYIL